MFKMLRTRLRQGHRTIAYPCDNPALPDRFRGRPQPNGSDCRDCVLCVNACPTCALTVSGGSLKVDLGRCIFCTDCAGACSKKTIHYSRDHRLSATKREDLIAGVAEGLKPVRPLDEKIRKIFGRSLKLRQVSAGGCNACEADINVLGTVVYDLGRFGIQFVASPRHADGLLVTGPVTENMEQALQETYEAVPGPKIVIASGACAINGGPFFDHPEVRKGVNDLIPVDLYIPGCPPHPLTVLDGLLRLLGRLS